MIKHLFAIFAATCTLSSLTGCAAKPITVEDGPIRIQSAQINGRIREGWTVKAVSKDGHQELADYANQSLKKGGYNLTSGDAKLTYSITEIYAGPASDYKEAHTTTGNVLATSASVGVSVAACALLRSCNDAGVVGNTVTSGVTSASDAAQNSNGQNVSDLKAVSLVIHSICMTGMGCASSAAASSDPSVTLDDLRTANAVRGFPITMRLGE
ncbi:hypothetical protein [Pseudomonas abietaniphila]|uniref:Lipoprotein n=1 Tax=Pseudomonas abietaniphila TaxID=89065 RepID=A0A1G8RUW2_9PSED|nr:hypothetical protein [Pseudomonas abietaniphila]SDJ20874.1 hypothetical protein SAMN05216605_12368 [Pseudomonas abietaniphila]